MSISASIDTTDLSQIRWTRGGYDASELSNVYSMEQYGAKKRAEWVLEETDRYVTDWNDVTGLGFCVSPKPMQSSCPTISTIMTCHPCT